MSSTVEQIAHASPFIVPALIERAGKTPVVIVNGTGRFLGKAVYEKLTEHRAVVESGLRSRL